MTVLSDPIALGVAGSLFFSLTDEELAAVEPATDESRLVLLPWLSTLDEAARRVAVITAFRSLVARGLAAGPTAEAIAALPELDGVEATAAVEVRVHEDISDVLAVRAGAESVICAQRTPADDRPDFLYLYTSPTPDGGALVLGELVEPTGLHRFFRADAGAAETLHGYFSPGDWAGEDGPAVEVPAELASRGAVETRVLERLGQSYLSGEVLVLRNGRSRHEAPLHGVFAGPRGIITTTVTEGSRLPVTLQPRTAEGLRTWIVEEVVG